MRESESGSKGGVKGGEPNTPSSGTSCLPPLMLDSIITPVMERSPAINCSQMESTTFGWLRWFLRELPSKPESSARIVEEVQVMAYESSRP